MRKIRSVQTTAVPASGGWTRRLPEPNHALAKPWRRWTAVVELFARRRLARRRVDPRTYDALYHELIGTCQALAGSGGGTERAHYEKLEDIVRPWLTPRTLALADRAILFNLLIKCRDVERVLRGRTWTVADRRWVAPVFLSILLGSAFVFLIEIAYGNWFPLWDRVQGWSDVLWLTVERASDIHRLIFCGVVVVPTSILILSRFARS